MNRDKLHSGIMRGKRGLILGVANDKSIAWGIAEYLHKEGAELAFSYYGDSIKKRVVPLAESVGCANIFECNAGSDQSIEEFFSNIKSVWEKIDFVVHSVAFSDKNQLRGLYIDTTRENFLTTLDISCFSFTAIAKAAVPLMLNGGSMITLSYLGANKVIPHYNVMGVAKAALEASVRYLAADLGDRNIRVNAISAGPVKTLAASGIGDFKYIFKWNEENAPLRRNISLEDVGGAAAYLLSDMSSGVTGEVHNVDCGYSTIGMKMSDHYAQIDGELD